MNLRWSNTENRFEAEFSQDFAGDLEAIKAARWSTTGAPSWVWHTPAPHIPALNRLKANRPASGLTISPEALAVYAPLNAQYEANEAVKVQLKAARKAADKEQKAADKALANAAPVSKHQLEHPEYYFTPEWYEAWIAGTAPPHPASTWVCPTLINRPEAILRCQDCNDPIYFYESQDPPACLWCSKLRDDELAQLFPEIRGII